MKFPSASLFGLYSFGTYNTSISCEGVSALLVIITFPLALAIAGAMVGFGRL
jgi:hypothetical protein